MIQVIKFNLDNIKGQGHSRCMIVCLGQNLLLLRGISQNFTEMISMVQGFVGLKNWNQAYHSMGREGVSE